MANNKFRSNKLKIDKSKKSKRKKLTCTQREKRLKILVYILIGIIFVLSVSQIYILKRVNYLKTYYEKLNKIKSSNELKSVNNENNSSVLPDNKKGEINKSESKYYDENEKPDSGKTVFTDEKDLINFKFNIENKIKKSAIPYRRRYIVLILDDGGNKDNIYKIANLHFKINVSIIPDLTFSVKNFNDIVKTNNLFPMIHIPMEPKNNRTFKLNKDFITLKDDYNSIYFKLIKYKTQLPTNYANNHMGSLISENYEKAKEVLMALKKLNIKFIDSKTTSTSKFEKAALNIGTKIFENSLFLDNLNDERYIISNFYKGLMLLNNKDYIVMIGHITKDKTIAFLKWLDKIEIYKYYNFITVKELFEKFK